MNSTSNDDGIAGVSTSHLNVKSRNRLGLWLNEMRAPFLTAAVVPIFLGTVVAWARTGVLDWVLFFLTLVAGLSIHIGANVANDYHDHKSGTDDINVDYIRPFTGGSRMIQEGLMTPREVLAESIIFFILGVSLGTYLAVVRGWIILALGLIGTFSAYFYTAPPIKLVSRGIGEIFIGLNFGILMTLGAYYVQTQDLSWEPILLSLPVALLISAVLYINEFPDHDADEKASKYTIVVRLGKQRASRGYVLLMGSVYFAILIPSIFGFTSMYALIALVSFPIGVLGVKTTLSNFDSSTGLVPAYASTAVNHVLTGVFLTIGYILEVTGLDVLFAALIGGSLLLLSLFIAMKLGTPTPQ